MKTAIRVLYRPFDGMVTSITKFSPSFVRITFGGEDLRDFQPEGLDQRLQVILPSAEDAFPEFTGAQGALVAGLAHPS